MKDIDLSTPRSQEDFEIACAECESVQVSTIKSWRKRSGGYSNEKIDDMYLGYSLATVALEKQKAITRRVSAESNRLFDEKTALIEQLEAVQRERDEARAELARRDAAAGEPDGYNFCHPLGKNFWSVSDPDTAGHKDVRPFYFSAQPAAIPAAGQPADLITVAKSLRDWIDAVPKEVADSLPTMPGIDRDFVDSSIAEALALGCQPEKVVKLENIFEISVAGVGVKVSLLADIIKALDDAGVKYETTPPADG